MKISRFCRHDRVDEDVLDFDSFILALENIEGEVRRAEESGAVGLGEGGLRDEGAFHEAADRSVESV